MGVIEAKGKASVAMAEEDHVGHGAGDEQVGAHVELLPVQQQRVLDVPGGTRAEPGAGPAWASSSALPPPVPGVANPCPQLSTVAVGSGISEAVDLSALGGVDRGRGQGGPPEGGRRADAGPGRVSGAGEARRGDPRGSNYRTTAPEAGSRCLGPGAVTGERPHGGPDGECQRELLEARWALQGAAAVRAPPRGGGGEGTLRAPPRGGIGAGGRCGPAGHTAWARAGGEAGGRDARQGCAPCRAEGQGPGWRTE